MELLIIVLLILFFAGGFAVSHLLWIALLLVLLFAFARPGGWYGGRRF